MRCPASAIVGSLGLAASLIAGGSIRARAGTYEAPRAVRKAADASFASGPEVNSADGKVSISFEASKTVDAEVAVLDAKGKVVRHLAAGLLGEHAPSPFAKGKLAQALVWDGKDDLGKPAGEGPFSVRVRLGATPRLEKRFGAERGIVGPITGLCVGKGGEVYVLSRSWVGQGRNAIRVFSRKGEYLRTIMPYPAKTPPERTKSVGQLEYDGRRVPVVFNGHGHALSPLTVKMPLQNMAWNPKGYLVAASTMATAYEHGLPRHLLAFHPQGGAPDGVKFVGPELRPPTGVTWGHGEGDDPCYERMAVSPDGKYVYYTHTSFYSLHAVYRLAWGEDKGSGMEAGWLGLDNRPGGDEKHLNDPQGLAVDAEGRVFVCDRGNNRVVVASPEGERLGEFPVEDPEQIAVNPAGGEIYVLCRQAPAGTVPKDIGPMSMKEYRAWKARRAERQANAPAKRKPKLVKLSAWKPDAKPEELARLNEGFKLMALDSEASPAQLWVVGKGGLRPVTDKGKELVVGGPVGRGTGLGHPGRIVGDVERNRALVYNLSSNYKVEAFDLDSGKKTRVLDCVSDFAVGPGGIIYGTGKYNSRDLLRFTADGKPLNFEGADSNRVKIAPFWVGGVNLGMRGMTVSAAGYVYLVRVAGEKGVQSRVDVFGPDGKLKKAALVDGLGQGDCGIGVDLAGNVYLGVGVKKKGAVMPPEFRGKVPEANWLCWAQWTMGYRRAPWYYMMRNEYLYHLGSVMKFGPKGGAFYGRGSMSHSARKNAAPVASVESAPEGAEPYLSSYLYRKVKAVGARWRYPGMGIVPASCRMWGDPSCVCMTSRLGVDRFGRVYVPNCFGFCVDVLDSDGNRLTRFGEYGNNDDAATAATADGGTPIQFAWPAFVDAGGGKVFVSDSVTRQLSVVGFAWAAEKTVPIR
jgi:DNA-binding beta-propeller fold protein YncE